MPPLFDKNKQKKARQLKMVIFGLAITALALFGGIFFALQKTGSLSTIAGVNNNNKANSNNPLPITPLASSDLNCSVNYTDWTPFSFHDKLIYCDSSYRCHVKTKIDSAKVLYADRFSDGLARVALKNADNSNSIVYVDTTGKVVIDADAKRELSGPFAEGLAFSVDKTTRKLGFIDKHGKYVVPPRFALASSKKAPVRKEFQLENCFFSSGLAPVYSEKVNAITADSPACGYIDHKGNFSIQPSYLRGCAFVEGRALILAKDESRFHKRWGFIDTHGKKVIDSVYMEAHNFSDGMAAVLDYQDRWGYVDKTGKYTIPAKFSDAEPFSEGLAAVAVPGDKKLWGYIHADGSWLIQPRFEKADAFHDGEAHASNGDPNSKLFEEFWINSSGVIESHRRRLIPLEIEDLSGHAIK
jgi:hypothetical protein